MTLTFFEWICNNIMEIEELPEVKSPWKRSREYPNFKVFVKLEKESGFMNPWKRILFAEHFSNPKTVYSYPRTVFFWNDVLKLIEQQCSSERTNTCSVTKQYSNRRTRYKRYPRSAVCNKHDIADSERRTILMPVSHLQHTVVNRKKQHFFAAIQGGVCATFPRRSSKNTNCLRSCLQRLRGEIYFRFLTRRSAKTMRSWSRRFGAISCFPRNLARAHLFSQQESLDNYHEHTNTSRAQITESAWCSSSKVQ